jgi:4-hydroxy-3-polyprenylbenzoate decarboxylase
MPHHSLEHCLIDLEKHGHLIRIKEEINPYLEMAALHLRVHEAGGPALLFENVKGTSFRAASNIFGTLSRCRFIFRYEWEAVQQLIELQTNPFNFKKLWKYKKAFKALSHSIPLKNPIHKPVLAQQIQINQLPLIQHWPKDGGAFITLPQVYTENMNAPGIMHSNIGMYRIQLNGNNYIENKEVGLHYQIHRGIGIHQTIAIENNKPLNVSIFIGGPPAHTFAAIMPLPENISEVMFAGALAGRRFRYFYFNNFCISADADFVITGEVLNNETKPEGWFGDHLGYYSLQHSFPVMHVKNVFAKKNAIWPFTVVGKPPQEDTLFGKLIHELTGFAVQKEIAGLKELHAVDAAGVHPLLLAKGSERYTPYNVSEQPAEILTIANHILGTGQLSLAKFLWITDQHCTVSVYNIAAFFEYMLERIDLNRDIHFFTNTTIDTLDYSGTHLNKGSKVVLAAVGNKKRNLSVSMPSFVSEISLWNKAAFIMPGIVCVKINSFINYHHAATEMTMLSEHLKHYEEAKQTPLIVICDEPAEAASSLNNFLWISFTRCNPAYDIYGVESFYSHKHWGCKGSLLLDARLKPHHAPVLEKDPTVEKQIERFFNKGGSLYGKLP